MECVPIVHEKEKEEQVGISVVNYKNDGTEDLKYFFFFLWFRRGESKKYRNIRSKNEGLERTLT